MGFYDLSKEERVARTAEIQYQLQQDLKLGEFEKFYHYFDHEDIYIRKAAYLGVGRLYNAQPHLRVLILEKLKQLKNNQSELTRQTVVNTAGEIGMFQFSAVALFFDKVLFDAHHKVRNAVIGSVKKMSKKNPKPVLTWAKKYMNHPEKEIRREVCHGIELRGRTHPEDILPLLAMLQFEETARVRETLVHVIGQIAYKQGGLPKVITALTTWKDTKLIRDAIDEIIDVHSEKRSAKFSAMTQDEVVSYIARHLQVEA